MKVRKNIEAVFLAAAVMGAFASYATADVPAFYQAPEAVATPSYMQVVVVSAKRLSVAEKAAL
jgi:hypothetical protein